MGGGGEKHRPWQQSCPRPPRLADAIERCHDVRSAVTALGCAPQGLLSLIFLGFLSHPLRAAAIIRFHSEGLQEKICCWIHSASSGDGEANQSPSACLGCAFTRGIVLGADGKFLQTPATSA